MAKREDTVRHRGKEKYACLYIGCIQGDGSFSGADCERLYQDGFKTLSSRNFICSNYIAPIFKSGSPHLFSYHHTVTDLRSFLLRCSGGTVAIEETLTWGVVVELILNRDLMRTPSKLPEIARTTAPTSRLQMISNASTYSFGLSTSIMAENVPPGSATANAPTDQPGRPYYESLRTNLRATLEKKRRLDAELADLEDRIYKAEGAYLEETSHSGNIVRGFDGWVKGVTLGGGGRGDDRRRGRVRDDDRVFSRSSVGWMKVGRFHSSNACVCAD